MIGEKTGPLQEAQTTVLFIFQDRVSLGSSGCPGMSSVDQAGLELSARTKGVYHHAETHTLNSRAISPALCFLVWWKETFYFPKTEIWKDCRLWRSWGEALVTEYVVIGDMQPRDRTFFLIMVSQGLYSYTDQQIPFCLSWFLPPHPSDTHLSIFSQHLVKLLKILSFEKLSSLGQRASRSKPF